MMDNNCTLRCIKPKIIDGKHIFPITCDIGTYCPLSSHGTPQVCGETLHPVAKSKKHGRCCSDRDDVPEEQIAKGCCNHGIGMDCMDPDRRACCLGVTNSVEDEIDWCQRNCSQPPQCSCGFGVDCRATPGRPASRGKRSCCLKGYGTPSPHQHCQLEEEDCSKYAPCPLDSSNESLMGRDCSESGKDPQNLCCISTADPACRKSCNGYVLERWGIRFGITGGIFGGVVVALICSYHLAKCLVKSARSLVLMQPVVVVRDGRSAKLIAYKDHYALICTAEYGDASTFQKLVNPNRDGVDFEIFLLGHRYRRDHVHRIPDATKTRFLAGLTNVVQEIQGRDGVLVLILLSGHGAEFYRSLLWAPQDADKNDYRTYVKLQDIFDRLVLIHRRHRGEPQGGFDCSKISSRSHFVFFLDFCRAEISHQAQMSQDDLRDQWSEPPRGLFGDNNRAAISCVCATGSGCMARDRSDASQHHSPFMQAFLENAPNGACLQSLTELLGKMQETLDRTSEGLQRITYTQLDPKACNTSIIPWDREECREPLLQSSSQSTLVASTQPDSRPTSTESLDEQTSIA